MFVVVVVSGWVGSVMWMVNIMLVIGRLNFSGDMWVILLKL